MGRLISVRLDDDAERALRRLEDSGLSRSEAIRRALIATARRSERRRAMAEELRELDDDPVDVAERREIAAVLDELRPSGSQ
jgi:Arc/MetJ-type ribon-helix-helix transcriptional regulator